MMPRPSWLFAALVACGSGKPGAEASATTDGDETGATPTSSGTFEPACLDSLDSGDETGGSSGSGEPVVCPPVSGLPCTAPVDCTDGLCGNHLSSLDEFGCPRATCERSLDEFGCPRATCESTADCGPGEACSVDAPLADRPPVRRNASTTRACAAAP